MVKIASKNNNNIMVKYLIKTILLASLFFASIKPLVWLILGLTTVDFITGIWRTVKLYGVKSLTSSGYKRTTIKLAAYMIALYCTFSIETVILGTGIFISKIVAGIICLTEFASITENLGQITGSNIFNQIFDILKSKLNTNKDIINKVTGDNIRFNCTNNNDCVNCLSGSTCIHSTL